MTCLLAAVPLLHVISCLCIRSFSVGAVSVGTLKCSSGDIPEMLGLRCVDVCCFQEVKWREPAAWVIQKNSIYYLLKLPKIFKTVIQSFTLPVVRWF